MINTKKTDFNKNRNSEGSSLAIALFFFLLCSLMCAGMLYLANSSARGVSKSLSIAQNQPPLPTITPKPTDSPDPTPTPEIDENYPEDSVAIQMIFNKLYYDYYGGFLAAENGEYTYILGDNNKDSTNQPQNLSYEILSYIHAYIGDTNKVKRSSDNLTAYRVFEIKLENMPTVKVTVSLTGYEGSRMTNGGSEGNHEGLNFKTFSVTVESKDHPDCSVVKSFTYTAPGDGFLYIRWSDGKGTDKGSKYFVIKNVP